MLIRKKTTESNPAYVPAVSVSGLDPKLMKQFLTLSHALNRMDDFKLPSAVADFVRYLVLSNDPRELLHFAFLHNQRALYNTLREFIKLHMEGPKIPEPLQGEFLDIASLFLTQAYCICHEPNNWRHTNNRWSYYIALELGRIFRPFQVPVDQEGKPKSPTTEALVYEE